MSADRRLVLLRHAKSDWPPDVADHERPLANRGRTEAPAAGRWLVAHGVRPDRVVLSDSLRTRQTWALVAAAFTPPVSDVVLDARVYNASPAVLLDVVRETPTEVRTLVLVGHNPGTAQLAARLDDQDAAAAEPRARMTEKYPTSALALFDVAGSWAEVDVGEARLSAFAVPRSG